MPDGSGTVAGNVDASGAKSAIWALLNGSGVPSLLMFERGRRL